MSPGFPSASPGSRSGFCFGRAFSCPPAPDWCSSCASTSRPAGPPQFGELWRRCLSAPALALLLGAALTAAVILLCALCYYHLTPAGHLPPEPWGGLPLGWIGGNHA